MHYADLKTVIINIPKEEINLCKGNPQIWDTNQIPIHFSNIAYNLTAMNSCVHEHVWCHQTTKFRAHEIKWFHCKLYKAVGSFIFTVQNSYHIIISV